MTQAAGRTTAADDVVDRVRASVADLVDDVLTTRRAHAAYAVFARIEESTGQGYAHDDVYRSFVGTALVLAAAGARAAEAAGQDAAPAVRWVRDNLGAWPSSAAARAGSATQPGTGGGPTGDADLADVQDDLREHLLPAVVWFLAGTAATAGGDGGWLRGVPAAG